MFCSVRGPVSCYIGKQPLYFQQMTLRKVIKASEEILTSQSGYLTTKIARISQKSPKSSQNMMFCSVRGLDRYYIGN